MAMTDAPTLSSGTPEEVIAKRSRFVVMAGWGDVPHITPEMIAEERLRIPPHEFEARSLGKPSLGAGAVYPVPESEFVCDPFVIPDWMPQCYALDVGWKRTAALWGAWDRDNDVVYLYGEHYRGQAEPAIHAQAIKARGIWIPGVIDPASRGRGQKDGEQLLQIYQEHGLNLVLANNALEAGIVQVWQRLSTGRLKVFRTLLNWIKEYRFYQRDDNGKIKDGQADHLMDDTRYLVMSGLSVASIRPAHLWTTGKPQGGSFESEYRPYAYGQR
jgi:hypothetical protein